MVKSDQLVIAIIIALLIVYIAVWVVGYFTHRLSYLFSFLNAAAAMCIIGYWAINQLHIQQHVVETREMVILRLELLVTVAGVYTIVFHPVSMPFKITQYVIFGTHFIALVAALIFMLSFKITKLF